MNAHIGNVALTIRFKEYLLNRDRSSRRVILTTCIEFMDTAADEKRVQALAWLHNLVAINDIIVTAARREQVRFDACWDELHYDLVASPAFMHMIASFGV